MHFSSLITAAAVLTTSALAQPTECSHLKTGFGYICANGGTEVHYCQPDKTPSEVISQYCGHGDCSANGEQGFCAYGITDQNRARGPTECTQVDPERGYICSSDYTTLVSLTHCGASFGGWNGWLTI